MGEHRGWLLDVCADGQNGLVVWFTAEGEQRLRLTQHFPVTFYAAGAFGCLRQLWRCLSRCNPVPTLARITRRYLFAGEMDVLRRQWPIRHGCPDSLLPCAAAR